LAHNGVDGVYDNNSLDYPSHNTKESYVLNDIVVIFNSHLINSLEQIN